jgi:hypothetical protein
MASHKKLKKFCRIFQWVDAQSSEFAGAIKDLCMEGALSASRRRGTTFLYPSAKIRKDIITKAYSDKAEEAVRLLEAHIIPDVVRNASDFRKGVGSRLGIKLEVDSASGSAVTLKGGAKLEPAKNFTPLRRDNMAVWEVKEGEVPLQGPKFEMQPSTRGTTAAKGGKVTGGQETPNGRQELAARVEAEYNVCQKRDRCKTKDPYLTHAASLLNFLKDKYPDELMKVLPVIDRDPFVTFYLLVEPYKTRGGNYLLADSVLFGPSGWNGAEVYIAAVTEYKSYFEMLQKSTTASAEDRSSGKKVAPWVCRDVGAVRSAIDQIRIGMLGDDGRKGNKVSVPNAVRSAYSSLTSLNAIGGLQPIFPDVTLQVLGSGKKLWQDELRFILHNAMQTLRTMPMYEESSFADIVRMLRQQRPGDDYSKEATLSRADMLSQNVSPMSEYLLLVKFVNSTDFLYIPVGDAQVGKNWGNIPVKGGTKTFGDPRDLSVYNSEASKCNLLRHYQKTGLDTSRKLDSGTISAIRYYTSRYPELGHRQE